MAGATILLRVSYSPRNYREFEIPADASLYRLAEVINNVYGFAFDHPFGFYDNLNDYYESREVYELFTDMGDPLTEGALGVKRTKIGKAFDADGKAFLFLFDYGDEWTFKVERTGTGKGLMPKGAWRLIKSVGKSPQQYR